MRKNFILTALLFLFINILGFANEKSKDIDVISILDKEREASYFILNFSSFTESKEIMDYINTNINKKGSATFIFNTKGIFDENGKAIYLEENTDFDENNSYKISIKYKIESLKNKSGIYIDSNISSQNEKNRYKYSIEFNKKFSVSDLMNIFSGKEFPNITDTNSTAIKSLKKEILYNNILIFKTDYQNKKGITTIYENGKYRKIIYNYTDDLNGTVKEYDTNGKLISEFILKDGEVIEKWEEKILL